MKSGQFDHGRFRDGSKQQYSRDGGEGMECARYGTFEGVKWERLILKETVNQKTSD